MLGSEDLTNATVMRPPPPKSFTIPRPEMRCEYSGGLREISLIGTQEVNSSHGEAHLYTKSSYTTILNGFTSSLLPSSIFASPTNLTLSLRACPHLAACPTHSGHSLETPPHPLPSLRSLHSSGRVGTQTQRRLCARGWSVGVGGRMGRGQ